MSYVWKDISVVSFLQFKRVIFVVFWYTVNLKGSGDLFQYVCVKLNAHFKCTPLFQFCLKVLVLDAITHFHENKSLNDPTWLQMVFVYSGLHKNRHNLLCVMLSTFGGRECKVFNSVQYLFQLVTEKVNWVSQFNEVWNFGKMYLFLRLSFFILCRKIYIHELIELSKVLRFCKQKARISLKS